MADRIVKIVRLDVGNSTLKQPRLGITMGPNLRKLFLIFADLRAEEGLTTCYHPCESSRNDNESNRNLQK